ncbi:hypothetical protein ES703_71683 [subsurface metagenome]
MSENNIELTRDNFIEEILNPKSLCVWCEQ